MKELTLMEMFGNPDLFEQLTGAEKAQAALITSLIGIGITMVVLCFIWFVIAIMSRMVGKPTQIK